ncbi:hypothetical protein ACMGGR_00615 [Erwinia sp. BNK-24-b]|uniref:hypothetical protein n=1 Tax=Erwinia TaxID=551 RepID=UPI001FF05E46|nr:hypothetical protein [Erwinia phyllosphaerae]MBV4368428.1 hypothetical protein [Erwinia phyllosphaerae]
MRAMTVLYWNKFFKYSTLENPFLAAWIAFFTGSTLTNAGLSLCGEQKKKPEIALGSP